MFTARPKAKCKKGAAARPAIVCRSAQSVLAPARLAEQAPPIAPDDDSGDDGGLHRQIAELQAQMQRLRDRVQRARYRMQQLRRPPHWTPT